MQFNQFLIRASRVTTRAELTCLTHLLLKELLITNAKLGQFFNAEDIAKGTQAATKYLISNSCYQVFGREVRSAVIQAMYTKPVAVQSHRSESTQYTAALTIEFKDGQLSLAVMMLAGDLATPGQTHIHKKMLHAINVTPNQTFPRLAASIKTKLNYFCAQLIHTDSSEADADSVITEAESA